MGKDAVKEKEDELIKAADITPEILAEAMRLVAQRNTPSKNPCLCKQCSEPTWEPDGGKNTDGTESGKWNEKKRKPLRIHHWFCDGCGSGPHSFDEKDLPAIRKQMRPRPNVRQDLISPQVRYYCGCGSVGGGFDLDGGAQAPPAGFTA